MFYAASVVGLLGATAYFYMIVLKVTPLLIQDIQAPFRESVTRKN